MSELEKKLLFKVISALGQFKPDLFQAGYNIDMGQAHYFIGASGSASTPFMHLEQEFYKGAYKRIEEEHNRA